MRALSSTYLNRKCVLLKVSLPLKYEVLVWVVFALLWLLASSLVFEIFIHACLYKCALQRQRKNSQSATKEETAFVPQTSEPKRAPFK